jgi:methionyl-tRNA synthetase
MLGFEGQLFGEQRIETYRESKRDHEALIYDHTQAIGTWEPTRLPPGQKLQEPVALFKKLDDSVVDEELARMGITAEQQ